MSQPRISIVVPTFHEAENLERLVPRIFQSLEQAAIVGEVIIVDDDSQDGTEELCSRLAVKFDVRLLTRQNERGLSTAVICGMRQAQGDIIVVMDADLSHPPEKISELVDALVSQDADFAIGSRYVQGGALDENWGWFRRLNSRVSTILTRPLTSAKDPMAGFFAIHRKRFESQSQLNPVGYKIGLELIVKCGCQKVVEIPICFRDRQHGESKLSFREQLNYLRHLKRLYEFRFDVIARPVQFLMVGCTGMVVDLAAFALLSHAMVFGPSRAVAIWVAMTWNFWLNRRTTFSDSRQDAALPQYVKFCLSCLVGAVVNWSVSWGLHHHTALFADAQLAAAFCGIVAGTVFNYGLSSRWAFRSAKTNPQNAAIASGVEARVARPTSGACAKSPSASQ